MGEQQHAGRSYSDQDLLTPKLHELHQGSAGVNQLCQSQEAVEAATLSLVVNNRCEMVIDSEQLRQLPSPTRKRKETVAAMLSAVKHSPVKWNGSVKKRKSKKQKGEAAAAVAVRSSCRITNNVEASDSNESAAAAITQDSEEQCTASVTVQQSASADSQ